MDVNKYVQDIILKAIETCNYDEPAIMKGIGAYVKANGFEQLANQFSEEVIKKVIQGNLKSVMSESPEKNVLYFSNYELIEMIRLLNNESLAQACKRADGKEPVNPSNLRSIEDRLDSYIMKINSVEGLYEYLRFQISEILLNVDYAKGKSPYFSQRMRWQEA